MKVVIKLDTSNNKVAAAFKTKKLKSINRLCCNCTSEFMVPFRFRMILSQCIACLGETQGDVKGKTEATDKTSTKAKQINENQPLQPVKVDEK